MRSLVSFLLCSSLLSLHEAFVPINRVRTRITCTFSAKETIDLLEKYNYDRRVIHLETSSLPRPAEVFINGEIMLGKIVSFEGGEKVSVQLAGREDTVTVDFGQLTTVWDSVDQQLTFDWETIHRKASKIPPGVDKALESLYLSYVGRARSSRSGLTKKSLNQVIAGMEDKELAESVLRKVMKAGTNLSRIVDSESASQHIFRGRLKDEQKERALAAALLATDSKDGGRFKRWPCIFLESESDGGLTSKVIFVNGGWLVLDRSVRVGSDARKFVQRVEDQVGAKTVADDRILRRMECLAMGEILSEDNVKLELDVRETLTQMNLEISSAGAKEALIRIGRWSSTSNAHNFEAWPQEILDAAQKYTDRRESLDFLVDGRVDMRSLPAICIDASGTSFRDDAIGIRKRESTGRRVTAEASQWEILVHIADISDIYNSQDDDSMILIEAAASRGMSRYDLPLGPLHLLPPKVLRSISFTEKKSENASVTIWAYIDERTGKVIDAGLERGVIGEPICLSYEQALRLMESESDNDLSNSAHRTKVSLLVIERILSSWMERQLEVNQGNRRRAKKLSAREKDLLEIAAGGEAEFGRTRSHTLVDNALSLYSRIIFRLLSNQNAPIPMVAGAHVRDGGRLATAPLRRYVDGQSQRQALAVLAGLGSILSVDECRDISKSASQSRNKLKNIQASKV